MSRHPSRAARQRAGAQPYKFEYLGERSAGGEGAWVRVTGGDLVLPVDLRLTRSSDGRLVVTALEMGHGQHVEVSSEALRAVKIPTVLREVVRLREDHAGMRLGTDEEWWRWLLLALLDEDASLTPLDTMPSRDAQMRAFAATYRSQLLLDARHAMTASAREHHISRATAHRWANECRRLGYLPALADQPEETA